MAQFTVDLPACDKKTYIFSMGYEPCYLNKLKIEIENSATIVLPPLSSFLIKLTLEMLHTVRCMIVYAFLSSIESYFLLFGFNNPYVSCCIQLQCYSVLSAAFYS